MPSRIRLDKGPWEVTSGPLRGTLIAQTGIFILVQYRLRKSKDMYLSMKATDGKPAFLACMNCNPTQDLKPPTGRSLIAHLAVHAGRSAYKERAS